MNKPEAGVEIFGSARLITDGGNRAMSTIFKDEGSAGMPLGHPDGYPNSGVAYYLGEGSSDRGHAITFGRTRGGKGVSAIIPALLTYSGSMVVIDPKGENAWITAERRRKLGQRVVILDPWGEVNRRFGVKAGSPEVITKFNPLSALDPEGADFHDDVMAIAEAFILQTGNDPHWPDSARELTAGLIAAEVQRNPRSASMKKVRGLLRSSLQELDQAVIETIENFPDSVAYAKLSPIIEMDDKGAILNGKELSSIRSTARTQTAFLDSSLLIDSMETDATPFDLSELGRGKVTLYLVLPVDKLRTHGRWLRMILTLAIRAIAKAAEVPNEPVVFMLDELGTISPGNGLPMIEQSFGLMAGLGIRIWAFLQDLPQLQRDYPKSWETFISNSSVIQLLNIADNTTAKYFSDYLGNYTLDANTGEWTYKMVRHQPGEPSFRDQLINQMAKRLYEKGYTGHWSKWEDAVQAATYHFNRAPDQPPSHQGVIAMNNYVFQHLKEAGITEEGVHKWVEEKKPQNRAVRFPWEIVGAPGDTCILILPSDYNYQLKRFVYYTHPELSKWARLDPNRAS